MKLQLLLAFILLTCIATAISYAQTDSISEPTESAPVAQHANENVIQDPNDSGITVELPTSERSYRLSLFILLFGILLIICEMILVRHSKICAEDTIKFIVITIIIVSTLFLITAGYSNNQIAPAVGLLGTITGYLLGKINPTPPNTDESK